MADTKSGLHQILFYKYTVKWLDQQQLAGYLVHCLPGTTPKLMIHAALEAMAPRTKITSTVPVGMVVAPAVMIAIARFCRGGREGPHANYHADGKTNKTNCSEKTFHARILL